MNTSTRFIASLILPSILLVQGCSDDSEKTSTTAAANSATTAPADPHAGMKIRLAANQGRVLEARSAGGYTYAQVEQNDSTFWIAGNEKPLKAGDIVSWGAKKQMSNFTSKALGETFDEIYFVSKMDTNHATTRLSSGNGSNAPAPGDSVGKVVSVENAAGYSYIDVETSTGKTWVAVSQTDDLQPGDMISWANGAPMRNFHSKALGKDFELIYFANTVQKVSPEMLKAQAANTPQGTVLTSEMAGGYSYLEVETSAGKEWVAVPAGDFKVGDTVSWQGAAAMSNFNSPSLGRTFDRILFAGSVQKLN